MPDDPDAPVDVVAGAEVVAAGVDVVAAAVDVVAGAAGAELVDDELELDPHPAITSTPRTSAPDISRRTDLCVFMGFLWLVLGKVLLALDGPR